MYYKKRGVVYCLMVTCVSVSLHTGPLHQAIERSDVGKIQKLLSQRLFKVNVNEFDEYGFAPLQLAAGIGNLEVIQLLLKNKAVKIDIQNQDVATPLHMAAMMGHKDVVQMLLDKEAPIHVPRMESFKTPLHTAVEFRRNEVVRLLLERGADQNAQDKDGFTPLHFAVVLEEDAIAALLIDHQAAIDLRSSAGITPLHIAVLYNREATTKLLLQHGASPVAAITQAYTYTWDEKDLSFDVGTTPIDVARRFNYRGLETILLAAQE